MFVAYFLEERVIDLKLLDQFAFCIDAQSFLTLGTPWTIACQASLPMELSRQEYWSGLPFPSPEDIPNPEIKPRSPALQANSLPSEPLGKPKNTGVHSLSLLQGIFPTQEPNLGLLHCRWIVYQLLYYLIRCPNVHCSTVYNSQDMETT